MSFLELKVQGESRISRGGGGSPGEATASSLKAFQPKDELLGFKDGTWKNGACLVLVMAHVGVGDRCGGGVFGNGRKA